ncbi:MAG: thioredoxin domain-containing protein [Ignavibacteria bacterium]|nr:thioredoxin domain-containing protein [Ignavibacteria bacterium]
MKKSGSRAVVTDRTFKKEVLDGSGPLLIDFMAEWCDPCRAVSGMIDQLAQELSGKVRMVSLDIDRSPRAARRLHVRSVPTILFLHDGKVIDQTIGILSRDDLTAWVAQLLEMWSGSGAAPLPGTTS